MIKIYTDGSCIGNPGKGGLAAIIIDDGKKIQIKGNKKNTNISFYHGRDLPEKHNHLIFFFYKFKVVYNDTIKFIKTRVDLDFASFKEDIWSH